MGVDTDMTNKKRYGLILIGSNDNSTVVDERVTHLEHFIHICLSV